MKRILKHTHNNNKMYKMSTTLSTTITVAKWARRKQEPRNNSEKTPRSGRDRQLGRVYCSSRGPEFCSHHPPGWLTIACSSSSGEPNALFWHMTHAHTFKMLENLKKKKTLTLRPLHKRQEIKPWTNEKIFPSRVGQQGKENSLQPTVYEFSANQIKLQACSTPSKTNLGRKELHENY